MVALAVPQSADASRVIAPPGNSGVSQYVEVVPGAGGSTPVGSHPAHGPVLTPAQRERLEAAGRSGKALASFVQQTGVANGKGSSASSASRAHGQGRHGKAGGGAGSGSSSGGSGGSLAPAVPASSTKAATGLGWGLPAALGAIALAAAGIAVLRRRAS